MKGALGGIHTPHTFPLFPNQQGAVRSYLEFPNYLIGPSPEKCVFFLRNFSEFTGKLMGLNEN